MHKMIDGLQIVSNRDGKNDWRKCPYPVINRFQFIPNRLIDYRRKALRITRDIQKREKLCNKKVRRKTSQIQAENKTKLKGFKHQRLLSMLDFFF